MLAMPVARSLQVAQQTGMLGRLAAGPASSRKLAERLGLREQGTLRVLEVLTVAGILKLDGDRFELASRQRKWLDPESDAYVGDFLADNIHYWEWWQDLEGLVRDGRSVELHDKPPEDPYWRSYITGQYQLAKLSSAAVAKAVAASGGLRLAARRGRRPRRVLDGPLPAPRGTERRRSWTCRAAPASGVRSWPRPECPSAFATSKETCSRPTSAVPTTGRSCSTSSTTCPRIRSASCSRAWRRSLRPGAPLCVLDLYDRPRGGPPDSGSYLGLFFHLTSGADTYSIEEVSEWLREQRLRPGQGAAPAPAAGTRPRALGAPGLRPVSSEDLELVRRASCPRAAAA